jgi:Ca2+-binding EF-hand superfamily protein
MSGQARLQYREMFNLYANEGKITRDNLNEMFRLVGLNPSPSERDHYMDLVFGQSQLATFEMFLKLFQMKCTSTEYTSEEILKGFRLLSDEYGKLRFIDIEMLIKQHVTQPDQIEFLLNHMRTFCDSNGYVNYVDFIRKSF